MRVLVTNDDGIDAEGIHVLTAVLLERGDDVVVAAPDRDQSGCGASLGRLAPGEPIGARRVDVEGLGGAECWAVAGPPALCVLAGRLGGFGAPPDLVVSGINAGLNTGRAILHSGTVGAALTAQNFGLSALAVSVAVGDPWRWETAARVAMDVIDLVAEAHVRTVLNLNVPSLAHDELAGLRWARLAPFGEVRAASATTTDEGLQVVLEATGVPLPPDCDQGLVAQGYAALTSLVGIAEVWPDDHADIGGDVDDPRELGGTPEDIGAGRAPVRERLVPGAPLHPAHGVPDEVVARRLRRPDRHEAERST